MKIISKFKDYYDYLQRDLEGCVDNRVIYNRNRIDPHDYECDSYTIKLMGNFDRFTPYETSGNKLPYNFNWITIAGQMYLIAHGRSDAFNGYKGTDWAIVDPEGELLSCVIKDLKTNFYSVNPQYLDPSYYHNSPDIGAADLCKKLKQPVIHITSVSNRAYTLPKKTNKLKLVLVEIYQN